MATANICSYSRTASTEVISFKSIFFSPMEALSPIFCLGLRAVLVVTLAQNNISASAITMLAGTIHYPLCLSGSAAPATLERHNSTSTFGKFIDPTGAVVKKRRDLFRRFEKIMKFDIRIVGIMKNMHTKFQL
jgi:hypothetical protein